MDRARRRSCLLILVIVAVGGSASDPPLRALHWLSPGSDRAQILTQLPAECLGVPDPGDGPYLVEVGRAAFRTSLILGGQAARAGIECDTCHRNGRTNRDFDFPGISGAQGTADVTSFLFSSHRGDHIDNPRPIPDLGGPKTALRIPQAAGSPDLERFIHGLVTEEFDGAEPPPSVLKGLAAYVRAMSPQACAGNAMVTLTVDVDIADARRAVRASLAALSRGDSATAIVMVEAARSMLGGIAERFSPPEFTGDLRLLRIADLDLAAAISDIRRADPAARTSLEIWLADSGAWADPLRVHAPHSYYNRATLAAAINQFASGHAAP